MLFDPHKGQWWNAEDTRLAYYMTLRVHYEMGALEAWNMVKKNFTDYPEFFNAPIATLRKALDKTPA
jgi:hypothetical protein